VLREMLGSKKAENSEEFTIIRNNKLHEFYMSPSIIWTVTSTTGCVCGYDGRGKECLHISLASPLVGITFSLSVVPNFSSGLSC
jgi:hypothetical protein